MRKIKKVSLWFFIVLTGCVSFYELNYAFNQSFERGDIEESIDILSKDKKAENRKARLVYYANYGIGTHLLGKYEESNQWFEKAYIFGEDYRKNLLNVAGSYFTNPNLVLYPGEDHEHLLLLYYKALNYLKSNDYESALVECRRLNQRLYELGDKYRSENKYRKDAFIHNLMGLIYDASGDYNNAFIAYRNALEIYENEYKNLFQLSVPNQLIYDLIRTARLSLLSEEAEYYQEKFQVDYSYSPSEGGELIFFWHNGLAPIKQQWAINFVTVPGEQEGWVIFQNEELGLFFPFKFGSDDTEEEDGGISITDISLTRVAFPKYVEREPLITTAALVLDNHTFSLEKTQDINAIAFKVLNERMLEELGKGLLRIALKKALEIKAREENENLGFLVSALNFATEQADTRSWQTLPHAIHYARIPLKAEKNSIAFIAPESPQDTLKTFVFYGKKGKSQFQIYRTF